MSPSKAVPAKVPLEQMETSALVDMLGPIEEELDRIYSLIDPDKRKAEHIRGILAKRVLQPEAAVLKGSTFFANVGPRNTTTTPKCAAIFKDLGKAEFLAHCEFGVEELKRLRPDTWDRFVTQAPTGSRKTVTRRYPKTQGAEVKVA